MHYLRSSCSVLMLVIAIASCSDEGDEGSPNQNTGRPAPTAVGSAKSAPVSATIGAAGGTISSSDGLLTVTFPADAVSADTLVIVTALDNNAHGGVGDAYRLEPDGATFARPVTLRFATTDENKAVMGAAFQTDRYWEWIANPTVGDDFVSVETTHFTDFSLVRGVQIRPARADVKVEGSLALRVDLCYPQEVGDEDIAPLGYACDGEDDDELVAAVGVSAWSVNGIAGGNNEVGTVSGRNSTATFVAPDVVPSSNPVAVSARVRNLGGAQALVVANITITDDEHPGYTATFTFENATMRDGNAQVSFTYVDSIGDIDVYIGSGVMRFDRRSSGCEDAPVEAQVNPGTAESQVTYLRVYGPDYEPTPNTFEFFVLSYDTDFTQICGTPPNQGPINNENVQFGFGADRCTFTDPGGLTHGPDCSTTLSTLEFTMTRND